MGANICYTAFEGGNVASIYSQGGKLCLSTALGRNKDTLSERRGSFFMCRKSKTHLRTNDKINKVVIIQLRKKQTYRNYITTLNLPVFH